MNPTTSRPSGAGSRSAPLTVDQIVDVACRIIDRDGLAGLSMRKLGGELGVDPMAVYHHVANKQKLLALVTGRVVAEMPAPDPAAPWPARVTQWANGYWDVVVAHRELTLAGLADPTIAAGGLTSTESLLTAIADSGLSSELVEPSAYIIVDAIHGSALCARPLDPDRSERMETLRGAFEIGLETMLAGIAARASEPNQRGE